MAKIFDRLLNKKPWECVILVNGAFLVAFAVGGIVVASGLQSGGRHIPAAQVIDGFGGPIVFVLITVVLIAYINVVIYRGLASRHSGEKS